MASKLQLWAHELQDIWQSMREKQLLWHLSNQSQRHEFLSQDEIAKQARLADLKKRGAQLEHELAALKLSQDSQLAMLKIKCEQDLKDYRHYLSALDQLKLTIQQNYQQLPEVLVLTIHHHAKQLLNAMWEAEDHDQKMHQELQLIQFMSTLFEESSGHLADGLKDRLPEKTLQLLKLK